MRYIYYDRRSTTDIARQSYERAQKKSSKWRHNMISISSDVIRGYNDTMILYLLLKEPSYGYEISRQIRLMSRDKYIIKETTLYSAFARMEKNGFVRSYSENAENGKRRTYYCITDEGRQYYRDKCEEWTLTKEVIEHFIDGKRGE